MRVRRYTVLPFFLLTITLCSTPLKPLEPPYKPPVVFAGYVNGDYDSLPGNRTWPNTCRLVGDTVRMYFYSETFRELNRIREGDLIRMDIYPNANDTLIGTRNVLFHMARYRDGTNGSYYVVPADSLFSVNSASIHWVHVSRSKGAFIELDRIAVIAKALPTGEPLKIEKGRIYGTIE